MIRVKLLNLIPCEKVSPNFGRIKDVTLRSFSRSKAIYSYRFKYMKLMNNILNFSGGGYGGGGRSFGGGGGGWSSGGGGKKLNYVYVLFFRSKF
jgi:uncharacterized membrane protein YgcG